MREMEGGEGEMVGGRGREEERGRRGGEGDIEGGTEIEGEGS